MTSKPIDQPTWARGVAEFVALEETTCHLLNRWLEELDTYEEFAGIGFVMCSLTLLTFYFKLQEYEQNDWEGFGGGGFGGSGASRPIHWPWEGNPLNPRPT